MKKTRRFALFVTIALVICYSVVGYSSGRHKYSYFAKNLNTSVSDAKTVSANAAFSAAASGVEISDDNSSAISVFEGAVISSDLIVRGKLVSSEGAKNNPLAGTENTHINFPVLTSKYLLQIDEIWYGSYDGESLVLEIRGDKNSGPSKPHVGDVGVFLLATYGDNYTLSAGNSSVYIQNPPNNRIFAFSTRESSSFFDRKDISVLKESMDTFLESIKSTGTIDYICGTVGKEYQAVYEASQKEKAHEDQ